MPQELYLAFEFALSYILRAALNPDYLGKDGAASWLDAIAQIDD